MEERRTVFRGAEVDLVALRRSARATVSCSSRTTTTAARGSCWAGRWTTRPGRRRCGPRSTEPYIVQERIVLPSEPYPSVVDGRVEIRDRMFDTAPVRRPRRVGGRLPDPPLDGGPAQRHRGRRLDRSHLRGGAAVTLTETSMKAPSLTLGIEEEYQIIDPETRELQSYITEILSGDHLVLGEVKPELHQSMVEIGTKVCRSPAGGAGRAGAAPAARDGARGQEGAGDRRRRHASVFVLDHPGDHPARALHGREGRISQDLAQQLLIFGTHVHIGIEDRDFLIDAMNVARYFVPHVLCLPPARPSGWGARPD